MKTILILLMIVNFLANKHVLAFYQDVFDLEHERITIDYLNENYFTNAKVTTTVYNETTTVFGGEGTALKEIGETINVKIEAFKFTNNQYRKFAPLQFSGNVCMLLEGNALGLKDILIDLLKDKTNLAISCPLIPGTYYFRDIVVDPSLFPVIPFGKYRFSVTGFDEEIKIGSGSWYGRVIKKT